jgi:CRP-like cAMP-binding protein
MCQAFKLRLLYLLFFLCDSAMFGELALLYDAPRSATVTCTEPAVLWSLQRDLFKYIQAMSASAQVLQRTTWMRHATELNALNPIDLSRLISTMQTHLFDIGDFLYKEGKATKRCILIEQGTASIYAPVEMKFENAAAVDKAFNIVRPSAGKQTSTTRMTGEQLSAFMRNPDSLGEIATEKTADIITEPLFLEVSSVPLKKVCEVYEGCILGLGALRGQNESVPGSVWRWIADGNGLSDPLSPYTVQANAPMECCVFTTDIFERLFGSIESVLRGDRTYKTSFALPEKATTKKEEVLSHDLFKILGVRGSGSFGTVVIASRTDSSEPIKPMYALKLLFKTVVVKTGQLRHVLDERNLLAMMSNPFIVAYNGSYQTPDELIIVTEVLDGPDLWTIIYETPPYNRRRGLPFAMAQFYAASILFGLAHIHELGVVYRDLKPENIMTDVQGYIRIIDFGFAKTVPFVKTDPVTGESKVHARTYTLCGTPEYLAPEFIFNLGHNQSADLWAYGVLVHEMVMGVTPFTPTNQNDVTQLFTNIALVQVNAPDII